MEPWRAGGFQVHPSPSIFLPLSKLFEIQKIDISRYVKQENLGRFFFSFFVAKASDIMSLIFLISASGALAEILFHAVALNARVTRYSLTFIKWLSCVCQFMRELLNNFLITSSSFISCCEIFGLPTAAEAW